MRVLLAVLVFGVMSGVARAELKPDEILVYKKATGKRAGKTVGLRLHMFKPDGHKATDSRPAIVFFFGGGWVGGTPKQFYQQARFLADRGMVAISAEYRVGISPFHCVEDGKSAIRFVKEQASSLGVDPDRVIASGGSAGGHVAACTGVIEGFDAEGEDKDVSSVPFAMVLFNPVIDTTEKGYGLGKVGQARKTEVSPCHHVKKGQPPTIIFHGTGDRIVPYENVERFTRLMQEAGNTCILVPTENAQHGYFNGSHFSKKNGDKAFNSTMAHTVDFLTELKVLPINGGKVK